MWKSLQTWCCWRTNHWRHELATNENIVDLQNFKHNVSFYRWSYSCCLVHSCQTTQGSHNLISARKDWIRYEQHFFFSLNIFVSKYMSTLSFSVPSVIHGMYLCYYKKRIIYISFLKPNFYIPFFLYKKCFSCFILLHTLHLFRKGSS